MNRAIRTQIAAFVAFPATILIALSALFCVTGETDVATTTLVLGALMGWGSLLIAPEQTDNLAK